MSEFYFGDTMISGWTDDEIEAYDAYMEECDKYDDVIPSYVGPISEPPF